MTPCILVLLNSFSSTKTSSSAVAENIFRLTNITLLPLGYIKCFIKYMVELLGKRVPKKKSIKLALHCDTLPESFNEKASSLILISTFFFPLHCLHIPVFVFFFFSVIGFNPVIRVTQECFSPCLSPRWRVQHYHLGCANEDTVGCPARNHISSC